jgi:hypothetical protein
MCAVPDLVAVPGGFGDETVANFRRNGSGHDRIVGISCQDASPGCATAASQWLHRMLAVSLPAGVASYHVTSPL